MIAPPTRRVPLKPSWLQIVALAAIGPLLLGLVMLWLGAESRRGIDDRLAVQSSFEYQREVERLASLMKDAETGQRGYVLSGTLSFLRPYDDARQHLEAQFAKVERLTPNTGADARDLRHLKMLIDAKFTEMQVIIDIRDRAGLAAAAARLSEGLGKRQMDAIRQVVATMAERGDAALAARRVAEERRLHRVTVLVWSFILIFAIVAGIAGFVLGRDKRLRNRMAIEREEAATRQRAIFDSATDAIILINPSGSIETINAAAERMFGYLADDVLRRDISVLIDIAPGDGPFLERLGMENGRLKRSEMIDVNGRNRHGEDIHVDAALGLMPLPDGVHVVAVLRDATARMEIDQLKDDFISTVSHELRTPLTSVVGSLGLLRGGAAGELPPAAQRLAEIAESNSQRLIRLINDILDVDQIRKGRMSFDYAVIDLREVITKTVAAMQGLANRAGVTIDVDMPADPTMTCADAERLIQAAGNLLSNAIKFSPEGSTVCFQLLAGPEDHIVQVTDAGPGVDPEFAKHIFNRFAQGNRPGKQLVAGTGLGLAISREIVRHHGGDISFENRREGGARFAFSIPRDQSELSNGHGTAKLLICEDDVDAGRTIQSILSAHGYASELVRTVRDGIAHARSHPYDALLLDLTLADADGTDVVRALKGDAQTRKLPIIVISGMAPPPELDTDVYAGWLQKPFDALRLTQVIQRAVRGRDRRKSIILHVDDDRDSRELFATALAGRCGLIEVSNLAEARAALAERQIDAVVLDVGLPDGSGEDLLMELKEGGSGIPVILYSAQEIDGRARAMADAAFVKSRRSLAKVAATTVDIIDRRDGDHG